MSNFEIITAIIGVATVGLGIWTLNIQREQTRHKKIIDEEVRQGKLELAELYSTSVWPMINDGLYHIKRILKELENVGKTDEFGQIVTFDPKEINVIKFDVETEKMAVFRYLPNNYAVTLSQAISILKGLKNYATRDAPYESIWRGHGVVFYGEARAFKERLEKLYELGMKEV